MSVARLSEQQIVDVLLGGGGPEALQRLNEAVMRDPRTARRVNRWAEFAPFVAQQSKPVQRMSQRVREKVAARLREAPATGERWLDQPEPAWPASLLGRLAWLGSPAGALRPRYLTPALTMAACLFIVAVAGLGWRIYWFFNTAGVGQIQGEVALLKWDRSDGAQSQDRQTAWRLPVRPGDRLQFPASLVAAPGAKIDIKLPDQTTMQIAGPADLRLQDPRSVSQPKGVVDYHVGHTQPKTPFIVSAPQGRIVDLGTGFEVMSGDEGRTIVRVTEGKVRLEPEMGDKVVAQAGDRVSLRPMWATVQRIPEGLDFAKERSAFRTNLTEKKVLGRRTELEAPPKGVREIQYQSGDLKLKAWVSDQPKSEQRRPAVVHMHAAFSLAAEDWDYVQPYLDAGYVVMMPSVRGENGNPGSFECFYGELDDVIAAGRWLASQADVDPARVFLSGHCTGGTLAILASMVPSPFAAVASFEGATDAEFINTWIGEPPYDMNNPREELLRSAIAFPSSIRVPLHIFAHPGHNTYYQMAFELAKAAQASGRPCQLHQAGVSHISVLSEGVPLSIQIFNQIGAQPAELESSVKVPIQFQEMNLDLASPLKDQFRPQTLSLSPTRPIQLMKASSFASTEPLFGVIRTKVDGKSVEAAVAVDRQPGGKERIFFDGNLNGDLTDDPVFDEGTGFTVGTPFAVGLGGQADGAWLVRRIAVDEPHGTIEYFNRRVLSAKVRVPDSSGVENQDPLGYTILDSDCDGDWQDADGALGVWTAENQGASSPEILAMAPPPTPTLCAGYDWTLEWNPGGQPQLAGKAVGEGIALPAGIGRKLKTLQAESVDGRTVDLTGTAASMLLLYFWPAGSAAADGETAKVFNDWPLEYRGLRVIGVAKTPIKTEFFNYLNDNKIKSPQIGDDRIAKELGVTQFPQAVLLDSGGRVLAASQNPDRLRLIIVNRLKAVLDETPTLAQNHSSVRDAEPNP